MIVCRKRYLTIFELLLVAAILLIAGAVVVVNINKALINQRFQTEVSQVVGMLQLAQDLMLIVNTNVKLNIQKEGEGIGLKLELDTNLPPGMQHEIMRERKLKTIHGVFFKDTLEYKPEYGKIALKFLSKGSVMSQGMMRLSTSEEEQNPPPNALHAYICLPGYPYPIASYEDWEVAEEKCGVTQRDNSYDDRIAQDTFSRLPQSVRSPEESEEADQNKDQQDGSEASQKKSKPSGRKPDE